MANLRDVSVAPRRFRLTRGIDDQTVVETTLIGVRKWYPEEGEYLRGNPVVDWQVRLEDGSEHWVRDELVDLWGETILGAPDMKID